MSYEPSHSTEHLPPPPAQADEHVASFKIIAVGVIALAVFGAATVWSARILSGTARSLQPTGPMPMGKDVGRAEVGMVNQTPFETTRGAERYQRRDFEILNNYGWVDREKGIIHIPIDRAIDRFLAEQQGKKP
ncbi:MAG TPA: hypothetical protein VE620_11045 [Myxococcales bacterium]|jgi:hypothetical protein|nr:hypothetical protein [Myxococcales bacterium]